MLMLMHDLEVFLLMLIFDAKVDFTHVGCRLSVRFISSEAAVIVQIKKSVEYLKSLHRVLVHTQQITM